MRDLSDDQAQTLKEWLAIATYGLAAPAPERIWQEVEAHFADAVEARVAEGFSLEVAEAAAVRELGDPKDAAWRFRKNHLTEGEMRVFALMREWNQRNSTWRERRKSILMTIILCLLWISYQNQNVQGWDKINLLAFSGGIAAFFEELLRQYIFRRIESNTRRSLDQAKRLLLYGLVSNTCGLVFLALGCWWVIRSSIPEGVAVWLSFLFMCAVQLEKIRLWRKLRRVDAITLGSV